MSGIINEDVLLEDCIKGVAYYAKVDKKRAAELAKTTYCL